MEPRPMRGKTVEIVTDGDRYHVYRQEENASLDTVIVSTIAELTQRDPTRIDSLSAVVDAEALERLFVGEESEGFVRFRFAGWVVTLHSDAHLTFEVASGAVGHSESRQR